MKTFSYLKKYTLISILAPLFKMLEAFFELLVPIVIGNIIDIGIKNSDKSYIFQQFNLLVTLACVGFICACSAQYFSAKTATSFTRDVKNALFQHIQSFSYQQLDEVGTSTLITRLTTDMNQIQSGLNLALRLLLRSPIIVFGAFIMAMRISVKLSLIFIVVITILLFVVFTIMLVSIPLYGKVNNKIDSVVKQTRENLIGVRVIRAFNHQKQECQQFYDLNDQLTTSSIHVGKLSALLNPITYVLINIAVILLMYQGAIEVSSSILSSGQVLALYNYMSQILVELIKLANLIIQINKALAANKRVQSILNIPVEVNNSQLQQYTNTNPLIQFENVSFKFHEDALETLQDISFEINQGEKIGVIGPTGSGKTTLVNLIARLYTPTKGIIRYKGKDINEYSTQAIRSWISLVPQKAVLFKGTVRSNLLWGNEQASDEQLNNALQIGQCSFIYGKEGLDSEVNQNGSNFSGGQRQRLTIARALVSRSELLILDDSSSALDFATEAKLRKKLNSLDHNPTIITISQRISCIMNCDRILVFDDGNLVGNDTHENLLKNNTVYQEIFYSQNKEEKENA